MKTLLKSKFLILLTILSNTSYTNAKEPILHLDYSSPGDKIVDERGETRVIEFKVSWSKIKASVNFPFYTLYDEITAKGQSTWTVPAGVGYADLYAHWDRDSAIVHLNINSKGFDSPFNSNLSCSKLSGFNAFRFRVTSWIHGGDILAWSNYCIPRPGQ